MKKIILIVVAVTVFIIGFLFFPSPEKKETHKSVDVSLAAPTDALAVPGERRIELTWQAVPGATSYNIYWSNQSPVTKTGTNIISCSDTRYIHSELAGDTAYYYLVTAVDARGESPPSREFGAVTWLPAPGATEETPSISETEFQEQLMNRLMNSERPRGEPPDVGQPTWDPNLETPPPRSEYPDVGQPTWDPNLETPPPKSEWPGQGEKPQWSPDAEPQKTPTPF